MREIMRRTLEEEGEPLSLGAWWPRLKEAERRQFRELVTSHWVQAHPPFMTLVMMPLTVALGVRGTCIAVAFLSLAALGLTLLLLRQLPIPPTSSTASMLVFAVAVAGWSAVTSALRNGQSGLLLGGLMTLGWLALRRGHDALSGVAVGVAASLKLYPGLLLVYLLLRRPRALAVALGTMALLAGLPAALFGVQIYRDYFQTADSAVAVWAGLDVNLSLLGLLVRIVGAPGLWLPIDERVFAALAVAVVAVLAYGLWRRRESAGAEALDVEYSIFLALMPLLSPMAWHHYLPILLLPLAVAGRRLLCGTPTWRGVLGFLGLLAVLATPEGAFPYVFGALADRVGWFPREPLSSAPTLALVALSFFLATAAFASPAVPPGVSPRVDPEGP